MLTQNFNHLRAVAPLVRPVHVTARTQDIICTCCHMCGHDTARCWYTAHWNWCLRLGVGTWRSWWERQRRQHFRTDFVKGVGKDGVRLLWRPIHRVQVSGCLGQGHSWVWWLSPTSGRASLRWRVTSVSSCQAALWESAGRHTPVGCLICFTCQLCARTNLHWKLLTRIRVCSAPPVAHFPTYVHSRPTYILHALLEIKYKYLYRNNSIQNVTA